MTASTYEPPEGLIDATRQGLGRHLALDFQPFVHSRVSLHECFPVFSLNIDAISAAESLALPWTSFLIATGYWHIQVCSDGKPLGYARVLARDADRVASYVRSDVAARIDRAIDVCDSSELPERLCASIVEIPSMSLSALLLAQPGSSDADVAFLVFYELPLAPISIEGFAVYPLSILLRRLAQEAQHLNARRAGKRVDGVARKVLPR